MGGAQGLGLWMGLGLGLGLREAPRCSKARRDETGRRGECGVGVGVRGGAGLVVVRTWRVRTWLVRRGLVRNEMVRTWPVRNEMVRRGLVRNWPVRRGPVRKGLVRRGLARYGLVRRGLAVACTAQRARRRAERERDGDATHDARRLEWAPECSRRRSETHALSSLVPCAGLLVQPWVVQSPQ